MRRGSPWDLLALVNGSLDRGVQRAPVHSLTLAARLSQKNAADSCNAYTLCRLFFLVSLVVSLFRCLVLCLDDRDLRRIPSV